MMYWDIVNGRGFLPSIDPPSWLFMGERWVTACYHLENLHYSLPQYIEDGVVEERVKSVLEVVDFGAMVQDADETSLYRLLHLLTYFDLEVPGACREEFNVLHDKLGYVPSLYYAKYLLNWRRLKSSMLVHYQNLETLTVFGLPQRLRLDIDLEFRAVDALRAVATVGQKTSPEKMMRLILQAMTSINRAMPQAAGVYCGSGECLAIKLFGVLLGMRSGGVDGLCEEHAKLFRRAERVAETMRPNDLVVECREMYGQVLSAYSRPGM